MSNFERALLYAYDSDGKPIPPLSRDFEGIRCRPTPEHALSHPDDGGHEEDLVVEARRLRAESQLTELERQVLRLGVEEWHTVELEIPSIEAEQRGISTLGQALDAGWLLMSGGTVTKDFRREALTYEKRAQLLGLSTWQVHRLVKSARKKLRGVR